MKFNSNNREQYKYLKFIEFNINTSIDGQVERWNVKEVHFEKEIKAEKEERK